MYVFPKTFFLNDLGPRLVMKKKKKYIQFIFCTTKYTIIGGADKILRKLIIISILIDP